MKYLPQKTFERTEPKGSITGLDKGPDIGLHTDYFCALNYSTYLRSKEFYGNEKRSGKWWNKGGPNVSGVGPNTESDDRNQVREKDWIYWTLRGRPLTSYLSPNSTVWT